MPFFWVRDINASTRFYVAGLGFSITRRWTPEGALRWCWLEFGDKEGRHRNLPDVEVGVGVSVCFQCRDAVALYRDFRSRGVEAKRPCVGNGMWVTSLADPDGYHLSFESPTDVPEETEFAEESR